MGGIIRRLGPGLIIAGSIVGSGELIATTKTGAQAGMSLLWLIVVGCVIKVFAQIELGRHAITHGQTTLAALDTVPGPRWRVNWIVWFWFIMSVATFAQLGGIVGGVGQAMAIAMPLTGDYQKAIRQPSEADLRHYILWKTRLPAEGERLAALPEAQRAEKQDELNRIRNHQAFIESMFSAPARATRSSPSNASSTPTRKRAASPARGPSRCSSPASGRKRPGRRSIGCSRRRRGTTEFGRWP